MPATSFLIFCVYRLLAPLYLLEAEDGMRRETKGRTATAHSLSQLTVAL